MVEGRLKKRFCKAWKEAHWVYLACHRHGASQALVLPEILLSERSGGAAERLTPSGLARAWRLWWRATDRCRRPGSPSSRSSPERTESRRKRTPASGWLSSDSPKLSDPKRTEKSAKLHLGHKLNFWRPLVKTLANYCSCLSKLKL